MIEYEGILRSVGSQIMTEGSVEHAAYSNKRLVLLLNKAVFDNPYGADS